MKKRVLTLFLAITIIVSQMPTQEIFAKTCGNMYGDVNGDRVIDLRDLLTLKKYISEEKIKDFVFANSDINADGQVDLKDFFLFLKNILQNGMFI